MTDTAPSRWPDVYGEGDPVAASAAEYTAARDGCAVTDLPDRALLRVTGPTRVKFLHNLVSNDVASLGTGQGRLASIMDVKGHLLALMRVLVTEDALVVELPAARRAHVQALLEHYRVAAPVRFQAPSDVVLGLIGPRSRDVLAALGAAVASLPPEGHTTCEVAGTAARVVRASDMPGEAYVVHLPAESVPEVWRSLVAGGAVPLGRLALDALRVEHGRPWFGIDVSENNLLHETGLLNEYHSGSKGCYIGQEVVARLEGRGGNVNRALRGLKLGNPAVAGATITAGGKDVGAVTTAAVSPRLGPIAMGYVHRASFAPGTTVEVDGTPATVTTLPMEATS